MLLEENQIAFRSEDDGVKDYSRQIAEMIGLGSDNEFPQAGVSLPFIITHNTSSSPLGITGCGGKWFSV